MLQRIILMSIGFLFGVTALAAPAQKSTGESGPCNISVVNNPVPSLLRWDVRVTPVPNGPLLTIQRVDSLPKAIHFLDSERQHGGCRPLAPFERRTCLLTPFQGQVLLSYSPFARGGLTEPLALFQSSEEATAVVGLMRSTFLCN
jgi:hypothetical protein